MSAQPSSFAVGEDVVTVLLSPVSLAGRSRQAGDRRTVSASSSVFKNMFVLFTLTFFGE